MQLQLPDPQTPWLLYLIYIIGSLGFALHIPVVKRSATAVRSMLRRSP